MGIRKARQTLASHAHSVDDWAHVVGASSSHGMGGARKLLRQRMQGVDAQQKAIHVKIVMSWMHATRTAPAHAFHVLWRSILRRMRDEWGCHEAASYYLFEETVGQDAHECFTSRWRAGYDRLQPGSACGSAPQESWHKCQLKRVTRGHRAQTPADLAEDLQTLVRSRLQYLRQEDLVLDDWPGSNSQVDLSCLTGDAALAVTGRTSARTLLRDSPWQKWQDSNVNHWFLFARTLLKRDDASEHNPVYVTRHVCSLPDNAVQLMARIFAATAESDLAEPFHLLGLTDTCQLPIHISDWERAKEIFGRWVVVLIGPRAGYSRVPKH